MNGKLFLSHAHADKQAAQALRRALEDSGVAVWEDVLGLRAGDGLSQLEAEVKGARGLLLLWTPAAIREAAEQLTEQTETGGARSFTNVRLRSRKQLEMIAKQRWIVG